MIITLYSNIYKPFSHGYPKLYKSKGSMTHNKKGSPIHAIFRVQPKVYQKGFDSVGDFDFNNPESDSWRTKIYKTEIQRTE